VRAVLVPALLALLGNFSAWPRRLRGSEVGDEPSAGSPA
jgi:RND superfamily putative drug exporter